MISFEKAQEKARQKAVAAYPTENGMFEGSKRLMAYYDEMLKLGWACQLGTIPDGEVERQLAKNRLDE